MPVRIPTKVATTPASSAIDPPAIAQQRAYTPANIADFELPRTTLTKLAKGSIPDNVKMQQDVVLALQKSATLFINYLSAAYVNLKLHTRAHDQAVSRTGKSITASDVLKAIVDLDFGPADNIMPLLDQELAAYRARIRASKASKPSKSVSGPGRGKRRKSDGDVIAIDENEDGEAEEEDDEEIGEADHVMLEGEASEEPGGSEAGDG